MSRLTLLTYKRKRQGKTNYKKRLALLKSNKPRFVVRRFSNSILAQIVIYKPSGDQVIVTARSNNLKKLGWAHHKGNLSAAYLTGTLCAKKAKEKDIQEAILDMGNHISVKGSAVYSALKGAIDAGLKIKHSKEVLPSEDRIKGKSPEIQKSFMEIKNKLLENEKR